MNEVINKVDTISEILQLVSFKVGMEEFGVNILYVQEINRMIQITKVPNTPDFVEGIINLRGRIIPVIELRTKLGIEKKPYDKETRIIVVEIEQKTVGFIVDSVSEVLRIPSNILEAPPSITNGVNSEFIKSIVKLENKLIILIDLESILSMDEVLKLNEVS
jgi:purine-binding chemotaxis protein CheW